MSKSFFRLKILWQVFSRWLLVLAILSGIVLVVDLFQNSRTEQGILTRLDSELFDKVEALSILAGLVVFALEIPQQRKRSHYEAWQVVNSAEGQNGSSGRIQALQDLNQDQVSLAGLLVRNAYLSNINLDRADLRQSDLRNVNFENASFRLADLSKANLTDSVLQGAILTDACAKNAIMGSVDLRDATLSRLQGYACDFRNANMSRAISSGATFESAILASCNMSGCKLQSVNFSSANLRAANLSGCNLKSAHFRDAILVGSNLSGAELDEAVLTNADIEQVDFSGAQGISEMQLKSAKNWDKAIYDAAMKQALNIP